MYARVDYAFSETAMCLRAALGTKNSLEILLAFILTLFGFGAIQFAIDHDASNVVVPFISGCTTATVFFFAAIGFGTFISMVFVFAYYLTIRRDTPKMAKFGRSWRIVLSFAIAGLITAAAFNLFYEGLRTIPFLGMQYSFLQFDVD